MNKEQFMKKLKEVNKYTSKILNMPWFPFVIIPLAFVYINIANQSLYHRWDITEAKTYSLSEGSIELINDLTQKVTITTFISDNIPPDLISVKQDLTDIFDEYQSQSGGKVQVKNIDPTSSDFKQKATEAGIPEVQYSERSQDSYAIAQGFIGASIEYGDKKDSIPVITDVNTLEYDTTSIIYDLTTEEKATVGFLTGHEEKSTTQYQLIRESLERQFNVENVSVEDGSLIDPEKIKVLVVAAPQTELSERDQFEIDQYIMNKGRVIFLADMYELDEQEPILNQTTSNLAEFVSNYGVEIDSKVVMDESYLPITSGFQRFTYPFWVMTQKDNIDTDNPALNQLESLVFFWANPINKGNLSDNQTFTKLLNTTNKAWLQSGETMSVELGDFVPYSQQQYTIGAMVEGSFESAFKDKEIPSVGEGIEDMRTDQTIVNETDSATVVVIGDADFVTDSFVSGSEQNATFFINLIDWLSNNEKLMDIRSKNVVNRPLDTVEDSTKNTAKTLNIVLIPGLVIVAGILYNIKRNKKTSLI